MPKFPCGICSKNVNENHHAICCDICDQWVHIRCNLLCEKDYNSLKNNPESDQPKNDFYCMTCINNILPFNKLSDSDYYSIVQRGVVLSDEVIPNAGLQITVGPRSKDRVQVVQTRLWNVRVRDFKCNDEGILFSAKAMMTWEFYSARLR